MAVATAIELGQLFWSGGLVLGSVFDPWDLAAYLAAVVVGLAYIRGHDDLRHAGPSP